jgi:hypothetical protein
VVLDAMVAVTHAAEIERENAKAFGEEWRDKVPPMTVAEKSMGEEQTGFVRVAGIPRYVMKTCSVSVGDVRAARLL